MLYLIGGSPKCGKKLSKELGVPWVASDTLQVVARKYVSKYISNKELNKLYPHKALRGKTNDETYSKNTPKQIAKNYIKQAKASYDAIDMFCICEISDGNDYIIEGYHLTPQLVSRLIKKYGKKHFKLLFLLKEDQKKIMANISKSSTPNDWVLVKTKSPETLNKIADMISYYGQFFDNEAKNYGYPTINMYTKQITKNYQNKKINLDYIYLYMKSNYSEVDKQIILI